MKGYCTFLLIMLYGVSLAQGKLVLIGGGSENENGWSNEPYAWAITQSQNKKVAVISYADEDDWIPNYFKSLGAAVADNIKLDSRAISDEQATYDRLMQYDVFFFKGGDQSFYYTYFKDTKTEQAVVDKFNSGGVISGTSAGMTILSKVFYAALGNSLYPDDVLQNFKDPDITLRADFLPFLPGFIVDSHLTERGRGPRLMGFIANWVESTGELLTGLGVDDRTALCIDENNIGRVFGTAAVSLYSAKSFSSVNGKMTSDSLHVTQLLHGHRINLNTLEILEGPGTPVIPEKNSETGNYQVILSGSEGISTNQAMLTYFVQQAGALTDSITVVTAPGKGNVFIDRLRTLGAFVNRVDASAEANNESQVELRNLIRKSKKVLFAENEDTALFDFLQGGPTGMLIDSHIRRNKMITAFIGEDSRYAGKTFVTNHITDNLAAYYGRLTFKLGLGLLATSGIMANTYDASSSEFYENTTAAIPFTMISEKIRYGIYLNRNTYLNFYQQDGKNFWKSAGNFTTVIALNPGTRADFATQPVNEAGAVRDYVGFREMQYVLLAGNAQLEAGIPQISNDEPYVPEKIVTAIHQEEVFPVKVFPNPAENGIFHVRIYPAHFYNTLTVTDSLGKIFLQQRAESGVVDLSAFVHGMYFLTITSGEKIVTLKLVR